ncbi:sodium-coupled monocarboxylate transporter 1-like isoform X2 [Rhodnius prolixus]
MTELLTIDWVDYTILVFMLILSTGIGLYKGIKSNRSNTIEEYLFGSGNVPIIPVVMSNMASTLSSILIVLIPSESYYYGAQLVFTSIGEFLGYLLLYYFFLPVFYFMKFTSLFEYLEQRFDKTTRFLTSAVFIITQILYAIVVMHSSCVAIIQAIPISFYALSSTLCILSALYTALGGLRGVVWSDTIQAVFMYICIFTITIVTIYNVGGVSTVIDIANKGGRFDVFNFDPSPFSRYSIMSLLLYTTFFSIFKVCANPGIIQRHLALSKYQTARRVALVSGIVIAVIKTGAVIFGIVIYASYHDCDPILSKSIEHIDQLVSYHVMKLKNQIPGLTGIFLAGILSAALSSLSTSLNTLAGIVFGDLAKPFIPIKWTNNQNNLCIKAIVVISGLIITAGMFILDKSTGGFQLFTTFTSLTSGFIVFVFAFGLFWRKSNSKATLAGAIVGVITTVWIGIGNQIATETGQIEYLPKIVSIEGCPNNLSQTLGVTTYGSLDYWTPVIFADDVPYLYRISFSQLVILGLIVSIIVGLLVSLFTRNDKNIPDSLLIPQIRRNVQNAEYIPCNHEERAQ